MSIFDTLYLIRAKKRVNIDPESIFSQLFHFSTSSSLCVATVAILSSIYILNVPVCMFQMYAIFCSIMYVLALDDDDDNDVCVTACNDNRDNDYYPTNREFNSCPFFLFV